MKMKIQSTIKEKSYFPDQLGTILSGIIATVIFLTVVVFICRKLKAKKNATPSKSSLREAAILREVTDFQRQALQWKSHGVEPLAYSGGILLSKYSLIIGVADRPEWDTVGAYCVDLSGKTCEYYYCASPWTDNSSLADDSLATGSKNLLLALMLWESKISSSAKQVLVCGGDCQIFTKEAVPLLLDHFRHCQGNQIMVEEFGYDKLKPYAIYVQPAQTIAKGCAQEAKHFLLQLYNIPENNIKMVQIGVNVMEKIRKSFCRRCGIQFWKD